MHFDDGRLPAEYQRYLAAKTGFVALLALLLALALGQLAAEVGQHGLALPPRSIFLRGVLGAGAAVALAITGSGLTAALKGRLR